MNITMAQLDPMVGDISGNLQRMLDVYTRAAAESVDLVVFTELSLTGYPPRDLLERRWFMRQVDEAIAAFARATADHPDTGAIFGAPTATGERVGRGLHNSAVLVDSGRVVAIAHKSLLPTYDVFDEDRYFDAADAVRVVPYKGEVLGISVCEDAWNVPELWPRQRLYDHDPIAELAAQGATLMVNISASPFHASKDQVRYDIIRGHALDHGVPFVYANQVGGNDELIFDGGSFVVDGSGRMIHALAYFAEDIVTIDTAAPGSGDAYIPLEEVPSVHDALILGIRDYMGKCGFSSAVIGLSGGIDSAVTCALAAEALGPENVMGVAMPSAYSSEGSITDARALADDLGIRFEVAPIRETYDHYLDAMADLLPPPPGVAEENIQARIRGTILMAISNKHGHLLLSTGNKSELAVGYCTLYGDMSGGLSVLADVPKMMVYALAHHINRDAEVIPLASITKPPSAELRPDQTDQDTLPPYEVLDEIIEAYVEEGLSSDDIAARGFDADTVNWVVRAINRNEYKRRQAAPGLKVTTKAFGLGRRMPIAARYDA